MKKLLFAFSLLLPFPLFAAGINTDAALPVAKGQFLLRSQVRYSRDTQNPTQAGERRHLIRFPQTLVFGATAKTALFATLPVVYRDFNTAAPAETAGIGDITFLLRHQLLQKDLPQKTFRLALIGGLEIPSGDNPFSSNSTDIPLGAVASYQTLHQEIDFDARYQINTEGNNRDHGDQVLYNLAYQLRLLPWRLPGRGLYNQINAMLEFNGEFAQKDANIGGGDIQNSGGHTLFISPGLQYVLRRAILETSFQYPIVQDLGGTQIETAWRLAGSTRYLF